jgi:hypothetical protein
VAAPGRRLPEGAQALRQERNMEEGHSSNVARRNAQRGTPTFNSVDRRERRLPGRNTEDRHSGDLRFKRFPYRSADPSSAAFRDLALARESG